MINISLKMDAQNDISILKKKITNVVSTSVEQVGMLAVNYAKRNILQGPKTGRMLPTDKTMKVFYQASAPGQSPANPHGILLNSIQLDKKTPMDWLVIANAPYSGIMEYGGRQFYWYDNRVIRIEPRPFIRPAVLKSMNMANDIFKINFGKLR